jgi:ubiquitin-like-conjugating enzyme ATG3
MDIDDIDNVIDDAGNQDEQQEAVDIDDIDNKQEGDSDNIFATGKYIVRNEPDETVQKVRSYDLSITYDFYYQTPRLWLIGYNENGQLLSEEETFEDIMADYANKTVTIENHPHLGIKEASIHPCNHAKVMKKIIDTVQSNGGTPQVHSSLFVFLKFISSVVPTIEYDFTIDLELE